MKCTQIFIPAEIPAPLIPAAASKNVQDFSVEIVALRFVIFNNFKELEMIEIDFSQNHVEVCTIRIMFSLLKKKMSWNIVHSKAVPRPCLGNFKYFFSLSQNCVAK